jgi:hypothetical protein
MKYDPAMSRPLLLTLAALAACGGDDAPPDDTLPPEIPHAVTVARATEIPACTDFVDAAGGATYTTIAAAIEAASDGAISCVAEGTYPEALAPGVKYFTLAGGFQSGQDFTVRDSSVYVTTAQGDGTNTFLRIEDPGPTEGQLVAVNGFEITGYSQAIVRDYNESQRFEIISNNLHDNTCASPALIGGGFSLNNVSGTISSNVIARNTCARGGGGALGDSTNSNSMSIVRNLVDGNAGDEPDNSHGGGLYLFANELLVAGNLFTGNDVTGWGGGLYVGAFTGGGQETTARLAWNIYRDNRAGIYGGGFFCDDSARCDSDHEIYDANCGGNIFLDCGPTDSGPTIATFDHVTNHGALTTDCSAPGPGVQITKNNDAADSYAFTNSIFWGNAVDLDFQASCDVGCSAVDVTVSYSIVQTTYPDGGVAISFGDGIVESVDPRFVDADAEDFHLQSTHGHRTPDGYVTDEVDSPALAAGDPAGNTDDNPARAGDRTEMGAYGNSGEASLTR